MGVETGAEKEEGGREKSERCGAEEGGQVEQEGKSHVRSMLGQGGQSHKPGGTILDRQTTLNAGNAEDTYAETGKHVSLACTHRE